MSPKQPSGAHFHAVGFYRDEASLCKIVADFLHEGFQEGFPALVIGTPAHRDAIVARLRMVGVDVDGLIGRGDIQMIDAEDTLAMFMRDGMPDRAAFRNTLIPIIEDLCRDHKDCVIRAYGEMVDLLWQAGSEAAAIRLEMFWNELANTRDFKLLCGYSMGSFYKDAAAGPSYEDVCRLHTNVVPMADETMAVN